MTMKKYNYPKQNACMVKLHNRRVIIKRTEQDTIGIVLKKVDTIDDKPIIFCEKTKPKLLNVEITETGILVGPETAFALVEALQSIITLRDIPSECLVLDSIVNEYQSNVWRSIDDLEGIRQGHYLVRVKNSFPKNCNVVVAEYDEDAKTFYSESSDYAITDAIEWKFI